MKNDRERDGLVGDVRSVCATTTMRPVRGAEGGINSSTRLRVYDEEGRKINDHLSHADGNLIKTVYEYNQGGKIAQAVDYDRDDIVLRKTVYAYDTRGNLLEWVHYQKGGLIGRRGVFDEHASGGRIERIAVGASAGKEVITYDDAGNRNDLGMYPLEIAESIETVYEATGNPTSVTFYGAGEISLREIKLSYDQEHKLTEVEDSLPLDVTHFDAAGRADGIPGPALRLKHSFVYDSERRKIAEVVYGASGSLLEKVGFEYDSHGNLTQRVEYDFNGDVKLKEEHAYELDYLGNWIAEVASIWTIKTGKSESAYGVERTIEYAK